MIKKICQIIILFALVIASFSGAGRVMAWAGCGSTYTVQWGDTLSGIAVKCDTTMAALWAANPGLGSWVYAGQVLYMPSGSLPTSTGNTVYVVTSGNTVYVVTRGDTLKNIAARYGTSQAVIANLNGIYNYNLIYVGQALNIPATGYVQPVPQVVQPQSGSTYVIQPGETLRILANRWGVSIYDILAVNAQITNANWIYVGQVINRPGAAAVINPSYYTVKPGDTLRIIANRYGTSIYNLQLLNSQIWNPNLIYPGMILRVN